MSTQGRHWKWSSLSKQKLSNIMKGHIPWNKGASWSDSVLEKMRGPRDNILGEKNPNWKGGVDKLTKGERRSREYLRFKKFIRERDKVCVLCGSSDGLHVDHLKSFTYYPELRYDESNARLLCFSCHRETPNFGSRARLGVVSR